MLKLKPSMTVSIVLAAVLAGGCSSGGTAPETSQAEVTQEAASQPASSEETTAGESSGETGEAENLWFYYPTQVGGDLANGMEEIVAEFNETHPDIHVTAVYTGSYKQTAQKAMSDLAAGNGPDVILSGMLDIVDYYNVGMVEDITPLIEAEGEEWSSDFVDGFWGNFVMEDGKTYGLPFQHSVCVLYYNQDILDAANAKAPENWEEMLAAIDAITAYDPSIVPIEFPSDVWVLEALTMSDSGSLIKSNVETAFDSQQAVDSLDFMSNMIKSGGMINSYASAAEDFVAGSCAMMLNTTGNLGFVAADQTAQWNVGMVPVQTEPGFSYGGGGLIMTSGQSESRKAASWEFMKYMTSPEVSAKWMTVSGYFAVRKSAADLQITKDYYAENPQLEVADRLLQYASAQWSTKNYWDVYASMQTALDSVLIDGSVSAADALAQAQQEAMAAITGE